MSTATAELLESKRSVLGRAFEILDCFSGNADQSISSLCQETGLPPATVHRMLANLAEWGAIERAGRGHYRLGRRLVILGNDVPGHRTLRDAARPCLVDLHRMTSEVAVRASIDGAYMVVVDVISGRSGLRSWSAPRELPLATSAPGLALLANLPYDEALTHISGAVDDFKLRQRFGEIRRNGVATARDGAMVWVSAPVIDQAGQVRSTMSSVVPADRLNLPAITRVVAGAARAVGHELNRQMMDAIGS